MSIGETIRKKRDGLRLDAQEIRDFVISYAKGEIPDYIASAFLMAVFIRGMDDEETLWLTSAMMESGETLDLSSIEGFKIDKHSTGGVGDKVSIILLPLVAACGLKIPMISGRGLGHTGGTIDKLEAIPGFRTRLSVEEFVKNVDEIGAAIMVQSERLVPADMKLYAMRDVTGTVESIPLIASSIMSKKIAEGIDGLVLDIKVGSGAFMKSDHEAEVLAEAMIDIGKKMGKRVTAVLTDMNQPLGRAVGNAVEMEEAIAALKGNGPADLMEVVYLLGEQMLLLAQVAKTPEAARKTLDRCLSSHQALEKFREIVERQGGDVNCIDDTNL
ncbi:thymidine phosphorylase, partial [candidate division TA06 bacterium]